MNRGITSEAKVGIFVLIALLVLFYMTFRIGGFKYRKGETYSVFAEFADVSGLEKGADVVICGVRVGKVGDIKLKYNKALVELLVDKNIKLDKETEAVIRTYGVMGDKYVELVLPPVFKEAIPPGGSIKKVRRTMDLDQLAASLGDVAKSIGDFSKALTEALGGESGKDIKEAIANFRDASESFKNILAKNEEKINTLVENLNLFSKKATKTFGTFNTVLLDVKEGKGTLGKLLKDEELYKNLNKTFSKLGKITDEISAGEGTLGKLVKDETLYNDVKRTFANLSNITGRIKAGEGTLGKLFVDDSLFKDAKKTAANLREITDKVRKGEGTLGKLISNATLYNEASGALKKIGKAGESLQEQTPITTLGSIIGILF